jgi:hypothetical protein
MDAESALEALNATGSTRDAFLFAYHKYVTALLGLYSAQCDGQRPSLSNEGFRCATAKASAFLIFQGACDPHIHFSSADISLIRAALLTVARQASQIEVTNELEVIQQFDAQELSWRMLMTETANNIMLRQLLRSQKPTPEGLAEETRGQASVVLEML